ncbi:MAG: DUF805 domain-containing protein [Alphaproteobacteria bacterium]|nr:DUF805 domain-containing protein [Alphaproteobacteria bacterium]
MTESTASAVGNGDMPISQVWFSFEGRIGRQTYWLKYFLPWLAINIVAAVIDGMTGGLVAGLLVGLVGIWVGIAAGAKRCHDRDRTGWFQLIVLIPIIGAIWLLIELGFLKGSEGENRFGPDPLA